MTIQHYPKDGPQPPAPALDAKTLTGRFPAVIETAQRLGLHLYNVDTSCTTSNRSGGFDVLCSATFHERGIEFFCEASSGTLSIRASADNQQSDLGHATAAEVLPCIATVFAELLGVPAGQARDHDCENALEELSRVDLAPHLAAADRQDLVAVLEDLGVRATLQAQIKGLEQARDFANRSRNEFKERVCKAIGLSGGEDEDTIVSHVVRVLGYTDELERREAALRMACARLVGWECPLSEPGVRRMVEQVDAVREGLLATIGLTAEKLGRAPVLDAVKAAWSGEGVRAEERIARVSETMADLLKSHRELEQAVMGLKERNESQAHTIRKVAELAGVHDVTLASTIAGVQALREGRDAAVAELDDLRVEIRRDLGLASDESGDSGNTLTVFEQVRAVAKEWRWFGDLLKRTRRPQDLAFFSSLEGRRFLLTAVSPTDGA